MCIRLPTNSDVRKTFLGTAVAADKRLIIVVFHSKKRGVAAPDRLVNFLDSVFWITSAVPRRLDLSVITLKSLFATFTLHP